MEKNKMKLAVLECERLQDRFAPDHEVYTQLLQKAFSHVVYLAATVLHPQITAPPSLKFDGFDVRAGEYPEDIAEYDGVLITGSLSGVYQEDAWIERLLNEIRELDKRNVRTVGIGFGHQAIAQAWGGEVARNPKGSEVS